MGARVVILVLCAACGRIGFEPETTTTPSTEPGFGSVATSCAYGEPAGAIAYVAPTGDDTTGTGSEAAPWATPAHAATQATAGMTIVVRAGTYPGPVELGGIFDPPVTLRAETRYRSRLTGDGMVVRCFGCAGWIVEGFEIMQEPGAQDLPMVLVNGDGRRVVIRNNVLHDTRASTLVRVASGQDVVIARNLLYNAADIGVHLADATNAIVEDNLIFSDFAASGRSGEQQMLPMIWLEDFAGIGNRGHRVRRNVVMRWEGAVTDSIIALRGMTGAVVENNLVVGNGVAPTEAALAIDGGASIVARHNTITGDLPGEAFVSLTRRIATAPSQDVSLLNNVWADPTGTMGDFADGPPADALSLTLSHNLYWNGGKPVPDDAADAAGPSRDLAAVVADPMVPAAGAVLPVWDAAQGVFADGSTTICEAFLAAVLAHGTIAPEGGAHLAATPTAIGHDILGNPRTGATSIGCYEPR